LAAKLAWCLAFIVHQNRREFRRLICASYLAHIFSEAERHIHRFYESGDSARLRRPSRDFPLGELITKCRPPSDNNGLPWTGALPIETIHRWLARIAVVLEPHRRIIQAALAKAHTLLLSNEGLQMPNLVRAGATHKAFLELIDGIPVSASAK
jgi:hypothetical protein